VFQGHPVEELHCDEGVVFVGADFGERGSHVLDALGECLMVRAESGGVDRPAAWRR
jgi:hypothetical protein